MKHYGICRNYNFLQSNGLCRALVQQRVDAPQQVFLYGFLQLIFFSFVGSLYPANDVCAEGAAGIYGCMGSCADSGVQIQKGKSDRCRSDIYGNSVAAWSISGLFGKRYVRGAPF